MTRYLRPVAIASGVMLAAAILPWQVVVGALAVIGALAILSGLGVWLFVDRLPDYDPVAGDVDPVDVASRLQPYGGGHVVRRAGPPPRTVRPVAQLRAPSAEVADFRRLPRTVDPGVAEGAVRRITGRES